MKKEKLDSIKKALLAVGKEPEENTYDPYKQYDDVTKNNLMYYFMDRARIQKKIEEEFGYVSEPMPMPKLEKKEPRWFVVHDDAYDTYVSEHHTKKEALKDMKWCSDCYLIKGKIVK